MGKITIKELCDKLKADPNEKSLFFKELSAQEFLASFQKEGMFDFTDDSSYWAIQYLERIYSVNTKNTILEIINENIKNNKIDDIHYSTYYQLVKLLDKFELPDLNKIDCVKLLKHQQAIELVKNIYKKEQIIEYDNLIKATISTLLEYKIKTTSFDKRAEVIYETYYLSKIINGDTTKKNFQTALSQEFLFDYLVEKYNDESAREMVEDGIRYLLSLKGDGTDGISLFPSVVDGDEYLSRRNSRLGWCYGDLGCAYLLYEASCVYGRDDWREAAMDIYWHAAGRRTREMSLVVDAGLCHGAAGIAMMFDDIYGKTGDAAFRECADYWMEETLGHACFPDGVAGYRTFYINDWYNDFSLLTGVSGIGMMMLSYISGERGWYRLLLP